MPPAPTATDPAGSSRQPPAFAEHDHHDCAGAALAQADRLAREAGLRLTPVRRRVLEILLEEHRALGAYEVLDRLAAEGFGRQPPVAYRALDFLVDNGLAHRIRRLNGFAACMRPGCDRAPVFLICAGCGALAELPAPAAVAAVRAAAGEAGFALERLNIEALGTCPACRAKAGGDAVDEAADQPGGAA